MISNYDKKYNRVSKLERSKWTSLKKLNGYIHYEVIKIDKKRDKIELFAVCEKEKRVIVSKKDLKDKQIWARGWKPKPGKNNLIEGSLLDQIIDGQISRKAAEKEVKQKARRKAELKLMNETLQE